MAIPVIKCPYCGHHFENNNTNNKEDIDPLVGVKLSFMCRTGMSQLEADQVLRELGIKTQEFECHKCRRAFRY